MAKNHLQNSIAILLALFLSLLPGCGKGEKNLNIRMDLQQEVTSLDPQFSTSWESQVVMLNLFEGLLIRGGDGELSPGAASDYTVSSDGLTYTFHLRRDGVWDDGDPADGVEPTPVTAQDFVFSFWRIFDPEVPSPWAGDFQAIRNSQEVMAGELPKTQLGVWAIGEYTLVIQLSEPSPILLEQLAGPGALPCNETFFRDTRARYGQTMSLILGNGPFSLSDWNSEAVVLVPSSRYTGPQEVLSPSVVLYTGRAKRQETTDWQLFLDGKSDFCTAAGQVEGEQNFTLLPAQDTVWALVFREEEGSPLADVDIRRALALSIDGDSFGERVPEHFQRTDSLVPHSAALMGREYRSLASAQPIRYQPEEARAALEAGLERLEITSLPKTTLLLPESAELGPLGGYLQKLWQQELRLFINLEILPDEEFQQRLEKGDFQMAITGLASENGTPMGALSVFAGGSSRNLAGYNNGEFDFLLAQSQTAPDTQAAAELCAQCEEMLLSQGVAVPLFTQQGYYAVAAGVSGLRWQGGRILFSGVSRIL